MIKRELYSELLDAANNYPVVTIIGPRQAGKTTLAKSAFPKYTYCNLEHPELRKLAIDDPGAFFARFSGQLIIDEIQRAPNLLSYIQVMVDEKEEKGQFILTGSHQLALHQSISQSLAGRTAILKLLPLSLRELSKHSIHLDRNEVIYNGFFPRVYKDQLNPTKAYRNYFETYVERDVRQLVNIKELANFEKFLKLIAGRVGQVINYSSLTNDIGVSNNTLKNWLSVLEASFIILKLEPYFENFGKRVIKSPKIYFTDTGLLCYLLGIEKPEQLERDPLIGQIFENLVVIECLKSRYNQGLNHNLFFYRSDKGQEVDLIYKKGRQLIPIEIKSAMTFSSEFLKGINYFYKISNSDNRGYVVYSGKLVYESEKYSLMNFWDVNEIFK